MFVKTTLKLFPKGRIEVNNFGLGRVVVSLPLICGQNDCTGKVEIKRECLAREDKPLNLKVWPHLANISGKCETCGVVRLLAALEEEEIASQAQELIAAQGLTPRKDSEPPKRPSKPSK